MSSLPYLLGLALLANWPASGQSSMPLSFEVASIRPVVTPGPWRESKIGEDRVDFPGATLRSCIAFAYGLKEFQVSGPAWIGELKYDILAKAPAGTRRDQFPGMMQTLLAQRFQLQVHQETREFAVYPLEVSKSGPKLKESPAAAEGTPEGASFGMSMTSSGIGRIEARRATMTSLANTLGRLLGRPVIDLTGLTARYDLDLEYSREDGNAMRMAGMAGGSPPESEPGISLFGSIQQFGLKLDGRRIPMPAIVVDRAEKTPTEN
jgi:uncharacterized protein (TIGR03435 family)